ncbi:MAG: hypothetical protein IJ391_09595 [Clostridia bacterium]|nr:hypothetical protein [Clostridia bacterium]
MFFKKKNPENICRFCQSARLIDDSDNVLCSRKGIVREDHTCRRFAYDFLKRDPGKSAKIEALEYVDINK